MENTSYGIILGIAFILIGLFSVKYPDAILYIKYIFIVNKDTEFSDFAKEGTKALGWVTLFIGLLVIIYIVF